MGHNTKTDMKKIPNCMKDGLQAWNNGQGIDLSAWVGCEGSFALAVGYASVFCPDFIEFEDYILTGAEIDAKTIQSIRGFEAQEGTSPRSVEWVMNHLHIADIQHAECSDITDGKLRVIGDALKKIYEARLAYLFPDKPCVVEFYIPDDPQELYDYQISFWQKKHE